MPARKRKSKPKPTAKGKPKARAKATKRPMGKGTLKPNKDGVVLLSGGNPQIAKADGDAPVQAYIAALSGWKHAVTKRLDALVVKAVPVVRKAVKWNSPLYGIEGQGFFLSLHVFANFVRVTWFRGTSLTPNPPGPSKVAPTRYLDVRESDLDEAQFASWVTQASAIPGWDPSKPT
jgi:hypothetical protein